jgi:hypothetical protein
LEIKMADTVLRQYHYISEEEKRYLAHAFGDKAILITGRCSGTKNKESAQEDLNIPGAGQKPEPETSIK